MSPFSHLFAPALQGFHEFQKAYETKKKGELKQNNKKKKTQFHKIGRIVVCFSSVTNGNHFNGKNPLIPYV